ncbi:hypothetical protein CcCBS67573_g01516 [Chytriomyces confervae]|uniref:Choline/carnitine acyltransferase domain-containing protein n=1 Tax=Chytriomyces confervae TaxID=246404 RepID=A0A507FLA1_9FUNG|nr:hypothetical protein HDU80_003540 [Chytriomyces hyalinus]TPX77179.1 hypothetical protein CcCBS67573_g01516 [Chytriomyces confervae]
MLRAGSRATTLVRAFAAAPTARPFTTAPLCLAHPPELKSTLQRHLAAAKVITPNSASITAFEEFSGDNALGQTLQNRVIEKDLYAPDSNALGRTLSNRQPLCVKSNWWFQLNDHPDHPKTLIGKPPPKSVLSSFQIERAAGIIHNVLNFKESIQTDSKFNGLFGSARIPGTVSDTFESTESKHIVVLTKDQIYKLDVFDTNGNRPGLKEIERMLYAVGADSLESKKEPRVGLLTAVNRTEWAENYAKLGSLSPENAQNLATISSAMFALCIDDQSTIANPNYSHLQFIHNTIGRNRWFDKTLQIILASSGRAGINAECSTVDAPIHAKLAKYLIENEPAQSPIRTTVPFADPVKLKWTVSKELMSAMSQAEQKVSSQATSHESVLLQTNILGERYISQIANTDVNSFIQLALQISWQRLHKEPTSSSFAMESAPSGKLVGGPNLSSEVWAFVESFDNDDILYMDKRDMFRSAAESLKESSKRISAGEGEIHSHIAALFEAAEGGEKDEIKAVFGESFSPTRKAGLDMVNIGNGSWFYAGFAQSASKGYGITYSVGLDDIKLSISNKKSAATRTSAYRLADAFKRTLADMMFLFPKRSEVWGYDWKEKFAKKKKEEYYLKTMKQLSDDYLANQDKILKKYSGQLKN